MSFDFLGIFRYRADYSLIYLFLALCLVVLVGLWRKVNHTQKLVQKLGDTIFWDVTYYTQIMEQVKDRGVLKRKKNK